MLVQSKGIDFLKDWSREDLDLWSGDGALLVRLVAVGARNASTLLVVDGVSSSSWLRLLVVAHGVGESVLVCGLDRRILLNALHDLWEVGARAARGGGAEGCLWNDGGEAVDDWLPREAVDDWLPNGVLV